MDRRGRQLPPLGAIRVFEAAARHLSFTKAATELGMTQGAVSYQIKHLEDRIGAALFQRHPRKLALTEIGLELMPAVHDAFGALSDAFAAVRTDTNTTLRITAVAMFAAGWLVPRLGRFERACPEYGVWLDTSNSLVDLTAQQIDLGIRAGNGKWPGLAADRLMPVTMSPMASPDLLASIGGVQNPMDLLKLPLLREQDDVWEQWFAMAGCTVPSGVAKGARLDDRQMKNRAAVEGQGVALLAPSFCADDITAGRLIQPFPQRLVFPGWDFYLVVPENRRTVRKVEAFRSWILAEIASGPPDGSL